MAAEEQQSEALERDLQSIYEQFEEAAQRSAAVLQSHTDSEHRPQPEEQHSGAENNIDISSSIISAQLMEDAASVAEDIAESSWAVLHTIGQSTAEDSKSAANAAEEDAFQDDQYTLSLPPAVPTIRMDGLDDATDAELKLDNVGHEQSVVILKSMKRKLAHRENMRRRRAEEAVSKRLKMLQSGVDPDKWTCEACGGEFGSRGGNQMKMHMGSVKCKRAAEKRNMVAGKMLP